LRVEGEGPNVVVGDPLEPGAHLLRGDLVAVLAERGRLVENDPLLDLVAVRAGALVLRLPGSGGLLGRWRGIVRVDDRLGPRARSVGQHASARPARRLEETLDLLRVPDVDDRHRELDDPEVTGAFVDAAPARPAAQVRL